VLIISAVTPFAAMFVMGVSNAKFPVEVVVDSGGGVTDTLRLADHDSTSTGNWITLTGTGGTVVYLPDPIIVNLASFVPTQSFTYQEKDVTVDATALSEPKSVTYPFTTHKVYNYPENVDITFTSNIAYTGETVEIRLIEGTMTGLQNLISESLQGDIGALRTYLHDNEIPLSGTTTYTLSGVNSFTFTKDFGSLNIGEYVAVVLNEEGYESSTYSVELYSMTPITVLDYTLDVTPVYNDVTGDLETTVLVESATGSSYSYGVVLVNQDIYSLYVEVNTDGTISGTTVDVGVDDSAVYRAVENNLFLGLSLSDYSDALSQSFWQTFISDLETAGVISAGDMAFSAIIETASDNPTLVQDVTDFQGTYWLMTVVWEHGGGNLVGFDQTEVVLGGPAAAFDSTTNDLPQAYANIVNIDYQITSDQAITGASLKFEVTIGGVSVTESTSTSTIDLSSGVNPKTYIWDTLLDVPRSYKTGGAVVYTMTLYDDSMTELDTITGTGDLEVTSKATVFIGRLNPLAATWSQSTPTEKGVLFTTYLNPLAALWAEL